MKDVAGRLYDDVIMGFMLLTRLPVPSLAHYHPDALARSVWTYPLVGALVGAAAGAAFLLARQCGLPVMAAAWLALAASVLTTGCFHEDGLADFWDGIGGGQSVDRKLEIMRDSRIGSYGATALILALGCRVALIAGVAETLGDGIAALALVAAGLVGRSAVAAVLMALPPARAEGMTATAARPPLWSGAVAVGLSLVAMVLLPSGAGVMVLALSAVVTVIMAALMRAQIGGFVGDGLGATEVMVELAVLAAVAAHVVQ